MGTPDGRSESEFHLIAAAQATTSWVRARRATWTDKPLPLPPPIVARPRAAEPPPPVIEQPHPIVEPPPPVVEPPRPVIIPPRYIESETEAEPPPVPEPPHVVIEPPRIIEPPRVVEPPRLVEAPARTVERRPVETATRERPPVGKWVGIAAAAIAIVAAGALGVPYLWRARPATTTQSEPASEPTPAPESRPATPARGGGGRRSSAGTVPARGAGPAAVAAPATGGIGGLHVTSTPGNARVFLDGKFRGMTPLTLSGVNAGAHEVTITSDAGSVRRSVSVDAGQSAEVDESIFPGWIAVLAPFELEISENGRTLRADERGQIMLPPGMHDIRLANSSLSYSSVQHVEVKPGAATPVRVAAASSTLTVTSAEPSDVLLDGARIGSTPLNAHPVPLGTHEVVVKRPGGDKRFTITVGTSPITLNADTQR